MENNFFEIYDEDDEDLTIANENWQVGKKLKFELAHLNLDRWLESLQADKDQLYHFIIMQLP